MGPPLYLSAPSSAPLLKASPGRLQEGAGDTCSRQPDHMYWSSVTRCSPVPHHSCAWTLFFVTPPRPAVVLDASGVQLNDPWSTLVRTFSATHSTLVICELSNVAHSPGLLAKMASYCYTLASWTPLANELFSCLNSLARFLSLLP